MVILSVIFNKFFNSFIIHENDLFCSLGKPQKKRIRWNLNLATKFVKQLMECTGESLIGLKNKHIGIDVWRNLESEFDTQAEYLRQFWYNTLHCQIFCEYDITMKRVRRRVFKM